MQRKDIVLIALLVLLVVFWFPIMERLGFYTPTEAQKPAVEDRTESVTEADPWEIPPATAIDQEPSPLPTGDGLEEALVPSTHDTVVVQTNKYDVILTTAGGGPVSIKLRDHFYRDGRPVEIMPEAVMPSPQMTFAGGSFSISNFTYRSNLDPGSYDATWQPVEVVYTYGNSETGEIVKSYWFYPDDYHFDLTFAVNYRQQFGFERKYDLSWNNPLGVTEPQIETDYQAMEAVAMMSSNRETLDDFEDGLLRQSLEGYTEWAGVRSKYFAAVIIPRNRRADGAFANGIKEYVETREGSIEGRQITAGLTMPFANVDSFSDSFTVFVGPLDYGLMADYDVGLEDMLGIGTTPFIGWLIKPFAIGIIWLLPRMYSMVPNYGMVIILFALLIKLITMPLSMKSFKSMQAMKDLQPKIEGLKKQHKKNPQALNKEMMKLYKAHGVNPISGCLPMLPQMPLFFAMFAVFRQTILLRDAPFIWFIDDLSRGASSFTDPYIILVLLMVAAQFVSQKLTMPSTQQNKALLYIMPLFMGYIFHSFAAGLVLYWACFSVFSLLDYLVFKRGKHPEVSTT